MAKSAPMVASRTQALIDRSEILAHGGRAFVENVKTMAASGMLDRQKMIHWVRIVSLFNKATGKDTSHGLIDMIHNLLSDMRLTHEERLQQQEEEQCRGDSRAHATDFKHPELDELACYIVSRGGHGAETMFCSEAMKQLFISTDELTMTVQETGLTSLSVWATFTTREGLATLNRAASTVFLQKGTEHVEVEVECLTRTGLLVVCAATVSFRVFGNGKSTLILTLTVKQDAPPRAVTSSFASRKHTVSENGAAEREAGISSSTRRTTYSSERLAALASKRKYGEEQKHRQLVQQQQQQEGRRRRPRPLDETPPSSTTTSISPSPSTASFSSLTSTSTLSSSSSLPPSSIPSSPFLPSSRPPPQRIAVSSKRRKIPSTVAWSQEGPPVPEAISRRLTTCSTNPPFMTGHGVSYVKEDKVFAFAAIPEQQQQLQQQQQQQLQQQQQQQLQQQQQQQLQVGLWDGEEEEHNHLQRCFFLQQQQKQLPHEQPQQEQQQQQQQQQVALAPACLLPSAFSALVSLPGVPSPHIFVGNSNEDNSSSGDGSTEHEDEEEHQEQMLQPQPQPQPPPRPPQQVPELKMDANEDHVWAWANAIWEEADGGLQPPLDLGAGTEAGLIAGDEIGGGMEGGAEEVMMGSVEDPDLWLMLEQQGL